MSSKKLFGLAHSILLISIALYVSIPVIGETAFALDASFITLIIGAILSVAALFLSE